jgi:membrane-associated phospholipid phosphatase
VLSLPWLILLLATLTTLTVVDALFVDRGDAGYRNINTIQRLDLGFFEPVMMRIDHLTGSAGAILAWATFLAFLVVARRWHAAVMVGLIPIGGAVNYVISYIVHRPRPEAEYLHRSWAQTEALAFPSGHVVGAVMLYGVIYYLARGIRPAWLRIAIQVFAVSIIVSIGFIRVWVGAHWVSDVVTAYLLGATLLLALIWVHRRLVDVVNGEIGRPIARLWNGWIG